VVFVPLHNTCGVHVTTFLCYVVHVGHAHEGLYTYSLGELDMNLELIQVKPICAPDQPERCPILESCCPRSPSLGKKSYENGVKYCFLMKDCIFFSPRRASGGNRTLKSDTFPVDLVHKLALLQLILGSGLF